MQTTNLKQRTGHFVSDHTLIPFFKSVFSQIKFGSISIQFPNHEEPFVFSGSNDGIHADMQIHSHKFMSHIMRRGFLGLNEAYNDGFWSTSNLENVFRFLIQNEEQLLGYVQGRWWYRLTTFALHTMRRNTKKRARKNIAAHYDLGNDFYQIWLDKTMTYSSAIFDNKHVTLLQAQTNKYQKLAEMADIHPHHSILEIGCGWGGFAEFIGQKTKSSIRCITISKEQYDFARERIQSQSLDNRVTIDFRDYRDVQRTYDRIVSIEMLEAVGEKYWTTYFESIYKRLNPGGKAAIQVITIAEERFEGYRADPDFIQKYIFPGGMLPTKTILQEQTEKVGLEWIDMKSYGKSYAKTLRLWNEGFQKEWSHIQELRPSFDDRFKRIWEQYLSYCAAGFEEDTIDVVQFSIQKPE